MALSADSRSSWVRPPRVFGPVLFYDLLRTARRGRAVLLRAIYATLLLYTLVLVYLVWLGRHGSFDGGFWASLLGYSLSMRQAADFAAWFFGVFMAIQMLALLLLTPAYTSGAISAEKERGTLTMMLATDLQSHEIVLGIFASRLANMGLFLLAGLPILSMMEFMGGVDPGLVLAGFIAAALAIFSLGALGLVNSVWSQKPRTALFRTYLWALLYLGISFASVEIVSAFGWGTFPSSGSWSSPVTLDNVIDWLNAGNPASATVRLARRISATTPLQTLLPAMLLRYACFHGAIAIVCLLLAARELRTCTLYDGVRGVRATTGAGQRSVSRRLWRPNWVIDTWPLLWKEMVADSGERRGWLSRLGLGLLVAAIFLPPVHLFEWFGSVTTEGLKEPMSFWVQWISALIGSLMLLQVAVRAAGTVCSERAHHTLETLLLTPLEPRGILFAKWLASVLSPRGPFLVLLLAWSVALFAGGIELSTIFALILIWLIYAAAMASLGLYCSVISRSTAWAILGVVIGATALCALSILVGLNLSADREGYALTPPIALGLLGRLSMDATQTVSWTWRLWAFLTAGLLLWSGLAAGLWFLAAFRFDLAIGRTRRDRTPQPATDSLLDDAKLALETVPLVALSAGNGGALQHVGAIASAPTGQSIPSEAGPLPAWSSSASNLPGTLAAALVAIPGSVARFALCSIPLLSPLILMLGWYAYLEIKSERSLAMARAEADRLDPGWRLEELVAAPRPATEGRNAVPRIRAAARLIPRNWPELETERLALDSFPPEHLLDARDAGLLSADLEKAAAALQEARRVADCPEASYEPVWDRRRSEGLFTHIEDACTVAKLLAYDVSLRVLQGDADGAVRSCQALVNAERTINQPAPDTSQRARLQGLAARKIEGVLARGTLSAKLLADLQALLEDDLRQPLALLAARAQRAHADRFFQSLKDGDLSTMFSFRTDFLGSALAGSLAEQRASCLRHNTEIVEIMKLPDHLQLARLKTAVPAATSKSMTWITPFWYWPGYTLFHVPLAELRCVVAMLAAERYRLAHGSWPKSLNDLVPAFLPQVPTDPFDGKPLRVRRLADGVVIYAVGLDGIDNGGKIDWGMSRMMLPACIGFDVGVRLWDVSRRREFSKPKIIVKPGVGQKGVSAPTKARGSSPRSTGPRD
jgi:ABC-type transport system involved in multi-copper enzyme maturation permease subunit